MGDGKTPADLLGGGLLNPDTSGWPRSAFQSFARDDRFVPIRLPRDIDVGISARDVELSDDATPVARTLHRGEGTAATVDLLELPEDVGAHKRRCRWHRKSLDRRHDTRLHASRPERRSETGWH